MSGKLIGQVYTLELPRTEREVLIAVCQHADDDGTNTWPSADLLAWELDLSERHVRRQLEALEAKGILKAVAYAKGGRGRSTQYEVHLENGIPKPERERKQKQPEMSAFCDEKADIQVSAFNKEGSQQKADILDEKADILDEKADIQMSDYPSILNLHNRTSINLVTKSARARENEAEEKGGSLRAMLASQSGEQERVHTALYDAACGVLDKNGLTKDQAKEVQKLFEQYGADDRFDTALIQYARRECSNRDKRNLGYFGSIIRSRLDDPDWQGLAVEERQREQEAQNGKGARTVPGRRQSNDRNARGNAALDWNTRLDAYIRAAGNDLQEFPGGKPKPT